MGKQLTKLAWFVTARTKDKKDEKEEDTEMKEKEERLRKTLVKVR